MTGIASFFRRLRGKESEGFPETIDSELQKILASEELRITPTDEQNIRFADFSFDNNPIHRDDEAAREFIVRGKPLEGKVLLGTYVAAIGEGFARRLPEKLVELDPENTGVTVLSKDTKLRDFIYPGREIVYRYDVPSVEETSRGLVLPISARVGDKEVAYITVLLGDKYPAPQALTCPVLQKSKDKLRIIDASDPTYFDLTKKPMNGSIPHMLTNSFVPGTMLEYMHDRIGSKRGINMRMNFDFYAETKPGEVQIDIFRPIRKGRQTKEGIMYTIRATVGQVETSTPLSYGELTVISPQEIDFRPTV